jgi:hypothetical protein
MTDLIRPVPGTITQDFAGRFWAKVDRRGPDECWPWTAGLNGGGYGNFKIATGLYGYAHRIAYELKVGPIPAGLTLDHLCRNRACANPDHLEPVTVGENAARSPISASGINRRRTHCPQGHPYDEANTYRYQGKRSCRVCQSAYQRDYYARRKARAA